MEIIKWATLVVWLLLMLTWYARIAFLSHRGEL